MHNIINENHLMQKIMQKNTFLELGRKKAILKMPQIKSNQKNFIFEITSLKVKFDLLFWDKNLSILAVIPDFFLNQNSISMY